MPHSLRVVPDSNIYISGLIFGGGAATVLADAVEGNFTLCTSPDIEEEVEATLRAEFQWSEQDIATGCGPLWEQAHRVTPAEQLSIVTTDPDWKRLPSD